MSLVWSAPESQAGIASTCGDVVEVTDADDVTFGARESDTEIILFHERTLVLGADVDATITSPGIYDDVPPFTPGTIPAGTVVEVYLLHADAVAAGQTSYEGCVTFDLDILGLLNLDSDLDGTDPSLGKPTTAYPTDSPSRGTAEGSNSGDTITLDVDGRTIQLNITVGGSIDQVRVVTKAPPVPADLSILRVAQDGDVFGCSNVAEFLNQTCVLIGNRTVSAGDPGAFSSGGKYYYVDANGSVSEYSSPTDFANDTSGVVLGTAPSYGNDIGFLAVPVPQSVPQSLGPGLVVMIVATAYLGLRRSRSR